MKVRCIYKDSKFLEYNKVYEVLGQTDKSYKIQDEEGCESNFYKWKFEEVKEMEKTFREVIRDIKESEAWSDGFLKIEKIKDSIAIGSLNGKEFENIVGFVIKPCSRFKIVRKEYTFEEAFKAYEEGKEIESCEGCRFKLTDKDNTLIIDYAGDEMEYSNKTELFSLKEIRGKWYIND